MGRSVVVPWVIGLSTLVLIGCATHRGAQCAHPATVVGTDARDGQGGWVLIREDRSAEDTAARLAAEYHVRTQPLMYLHGFSLYPVPQDPKFLCEKALVELHYAAPPAVAAR